ncbi:uncharacterized protein HD556DRAFT_60543 [Suillus plorans]|uniref:Uncharacterized protein n=1 Tax=Suillus plorans TaxID=116603 RepID=A0A9P7DP86_9AGAM|nr:uncharacterized protein HD556DRAFT_60543 [Suillus plorans]KAG1799727.1 hypothetical protein HD556DRAFT_60543 [Suillus plorans]
MIKGHLTHIFNILKKWLSRLARRPTGLFFVVLSSLYRFVPGHLKLGDRSTRFRSGVLPRSQEVIKGEDSPICLSLLPPGQMEREAGEEPPLPSDDPYTRSHSRHPRPLRNSTAIPPSDANQTTIGYGVSASQTDGHYQGSVSSLHMSLHMEESSVKGEIPPKDGALEEPSGPGPSRLPGLHGISTTHERPRGYLNDASKVRTGKTAYRKHTGQIKPHRRSAYSITDESANMGSVPLDSSAQAIPIVIPGQCLDHHVHYTAPPGNNEQVPASEVVIVYDGPQLSSMVPDDIRRYGRCRFREYKVTDFTIPALTLAAHR